jgi:hypothetical protein
MVIGVCYVEAEESVLHLLVFLLLRLLVDLFEIQVSETRCRRRSVWHLTIQKDLWDRGAVLVSDGDEDVWIPV